MYLIDTFIFYISDLTISKSYFILKGHSPAGGCLMAMSCDYRIMVKGPYKIGLNETQLVSKLYFFGLKNEQPFIILHLKGNRRSLLVQRNHGKHDWSP